MDRKDFLKSAVFAGLAICVGCSANSSDVPTAPSNVDFTLDLSQSDYQTLNTIGGYLVTKGIIIARISQSSFTAVSAACTHQGTTLQFQKNNNRFYCNNHGSTFAIDGTVTGGPATKSLNKYNTSLNGNALRIYS